jgi:hypothetical protein
MLGQSGRLARSPRKSDAFPSNFYNAINLGDREGAMLSILEEAGLPDGTPSPRAQELLDNGEWDAKRQESLRCLGLVNCAGYIAGDSKRICGKLRCITAAHKKAGGVAPGWYMTSVSKCYLAKPALPIEANGGPIQSGGAALLSQTAKPFELSMGQWRFVIEAWLEASLAVESVESEDQEGDVEDEPEEPADPTWTMPDPSQESNGRSNYEDFGRPQLMVDTDFVAAGESDEQRAAEEMARMMRQLMYEVDRLKSREGSLTTQLGIMRTEQAGLAGDLSRAHKDAVALRTHVGRLIGQVRQLEEDREMYKHRWTR